MKEVSIVGLDLAKRVFQVHAAGADGGVVLRRKLSRGQILPFFAELPRCIVAMEACATAHYWAREIGKTGHEVRLLPPAYVKPFVKRQKNDAADAEAIVEAATRPSMRFVVPRTEPQQACSMLLRTRDLFVRQRTQLINALRAHLAEHGIIAPQGIANLASLAEIIEDHGSGLELIVVETARLYLDQIDALSSRIASLEKALRSEAKRSQSTARLMSMPGMGPITAMAVEAFAPTMVTLV
ncbi:IS110 family transposase [Sinorhizobium medicae]|nr:IS110 family transposase [Sinorhizobium medicae]MDX0469398.1 IS110 family transposase [Sinorhizobium medicae]MDX0475721.1 IS110 family transposase [Sinorhizobium medicae]MDX0900957.1 IS110 family transposase [Sinorhizobium medicae]MDX1176568.1 IS110 family transposase [Sinorhizobium medicae]